MSYLIHLPLLISAITWHNFLLLSSKYALGTRPGVEQKSVSNLPKNFLKEVIIISMDISGEKSEARRDQVSHTLRSQE